MRISLTAVVVMAGVCLMIAGLTLAAESNVYWRADLHQGTSIIAYGQGATEEAAKLDCHRLQAITRAMTVAETRKLAVSAVTTQAVRWCNNPRRYSTVTPDPVTPSGVATLSWTPPTLYTNGAQFTDLRNYRILYSQTQGGLSDCAAAIGCRIVETLAGPASSFTVTGLSPGTWYFAVRAVAASGVESENSNVVSKVIL